MQSLKAIINLQVPVIMLRLNSMTLKVFSSLSDSMLLFLKLKTAPPRNLNFSDNKSGFGMWRLWGAGKWTKV